MQVNDQGKIDRQDEPMAEGPLTEMTIDGVGLTMEIFKQRAAQLGATGEMSPNLQHLLDLNKILKAWDHTHGTVTDTDAVLVMANARLGVREGNKGISDQMLAVRGCVTDICRLAQQLFENNPEIRHAFEVAAVLIQNGTPVYDERQLGDIIEIHKMVRG